MRLYASNELKSRLTHAAANGSVIAADILSELKKNRPAQEIIRGSYSFLSTKRKWTDCGSFRKIRIVFTAFNKDPEHPNFPDRNNPQAPWFPENRTDLEPSTFIEQFKNLREYTSCEISYFRSAITLDSKVSVRLHTGMNDFLDAYQESNYSSITDGDTSTLHNSCMRYEDKARNAADFYANFAGAGILVARDEGNNVIGRAVVWRKAVWNTTGMPAVQVSVLDRIYILNGDASLIRLVRTPTEKAQMLAVGRNSSLVGHIKNPTEKVQLMAVHDSPANILRIKNPSRQACLSCLGSVMPGGTAGIHFKEDISEAVKNLFTRLGEIEERYGELMRDAGHMDTYDARYEATEKAEAYRTRKISAAVGTFRKEAVLETSAVPEKTVVVEKTEATEAQPSSGEMRFKGGRRELTIRNGSAVLRTNGESFDATDILKDMRAHGVDIGRVSGKAMSEMLKGNKTALPGASGNSVFAIVKGPAGYGLKAFQIAKQVHSAAAQEI